MNTYTICPQCHEEDLQLVWEYDTAPDGEFWRISDAICSNKCELTGDEMEKLDSENELTMEDINSYYEPSF